MLSAIFDCTAGEDLISSLLSRTAAIKEAAISRAAVGFSSFLLLLVSGLRCSEHVLLRADCPLNTSAEL